MRASKLFLLITLATSAFAEASNVSPKSRGKRNYEKQVQYQNGLSTQNKARAFIAAKTKSKAKTKQDSPKALQESQGATNK